MSRLLKGFNVNLKIFPNESIKIRTFSNEKGKKWFFIPFTVNQKQIKWFQEILNAEKYTVTIKRKIIKGDLRYFAYVSYDIPESEIQYNFKNGAVGLDFNYNFVSLSNVDKERNL